MPKLSIKFASIRVLLELLAKLKPGDPAVHRLKRMIRFLLHRGRVEIQEGEIVPRKTGYLKGALAKARKLRAKKKKQESKAEPENDYSFESEAKK
jgi:hypothetical protein